jgi:hypothetical protein
MKVRNTIQEGKKSPTCILNADGDPDPTFHIHADPDPNFYFDADPDPASQNDAGFINDILCTR